MTELEKLVQTWEKYKPTGTPHEHIWNGFIDDAKAAIEREKQALSLGDVVNRRELLLAWEKHSYGSEWSMHEDQIVPSIDEYLSQ